MASPDVLVLGAWDYITDTLIAHPANPAGTTFNLNDGVIFSLMDTNGKGDGFQWAPDKPTTYKHKNPHTVGEQIDIIVNDTNRMVVAKLVWAGTAWSTWNQSIQNLATLCKGITVNQPAVLEHQPTGSSTPLYWDVVQATLEWQYEEVPAIAFIQDTVTVVFECKPFIRGKRQWLQNLALNPGFEAPSGPAVTVFSDNFTNTNAYTVAAGSVASDKSWYPDVVQADSPIRYCRLDEASGGLAYDSANYLNGTTHGSPTQGTTGLLTGDTDTAYTFASASSQYISFSSAGVATANHPWSLEAWIKTPSSFSAQMMVVAFGLSGTNHEEAQIYLDATGKAYAGTYGGDTAGYALAANTVYSLVATWDGTTLTLYVNGVSRETATPGAMTIPGSGIYTTIGATAASSPTLFFNGVIDEVAIYTTALSSTRVAAHYTAGTTTPTTAANTMQVSNGGRVAFGSATWNAINQWAVPFRYYSALDARFHLHYTDGNNQLFAQVQGSQLNLYQRVAGTLHSLASVTFVPSNEVVYWLVCTQFPLTPNSSALNASFAYLEAAIYSNADGALGTQLVTTGEVGSFNTVTALSGIMSIQSAAGNVLGLGYTTTSAPMTVGLFGPGGWYNYSVGTGVASGAWQQNSANTYPSGPKTSFGAAVLSAAPAGTLDAYWYTANLASGATVQSTGYKTTSGEIFYASCWLTSPAVGAGCAQKLYGYEYDTNGAFLRSTLLASVTGPQSGWVTLAGNWTTGASCVYVAVMIRATDGTTGSAGTTVTIDDVSWWDSTQTGMTTMPYCELRFPQAPAQLLISGIQGNTQAPAMFAIGTYLVNWPNLGTIKIYAGQRAYPASSLLIAPAALSGSETLDVNSYGGYWSLAYGAPVIELPVAVASGTYHLFSRAQASSGTPSSVYSYVEFNEYSANGTLLGTILTPSITGEFTSANVWTTIDSGQIALPPQPINTYGDPTQIICVVNPYISSGSQFGQGVLVPIDAGYIASTLTNNTGSAVTNTWTFAWFDSLARSTMFSQETTPVATPSHAAGVTNISGGSIVGIQSVGNSQAFLDPTLAINTSGVNQWVVLITDQSADVVPIAVDILYSPLYTYPL